MSPSIAENKNKRKLRIHPEPFRSSYLAIPTSPFSPCTPLARSSYPPQHRTRNYPIPNDPVRPPSPLKWVWQCHQCRRTYSVGVTRRCLDDGHYFCVGTTTIKSWRKPVRSGKVKKHRACASEFDYQGWKTWGRWRRSGRKALTHDANPLSPRCPTSEDDAFSECSRQTNAPVMDCWNSCDYPSECRWGKRFGIHTPVVAEFPVIDLHPTPPPPPCTSFEGVVKPEPCKKVKKDKKSERMDLWDSLVASARRRKSVSPSSPLASVTEEPARVEPPVVPPKDKDGDMVMMTIDPALLSQQPLDNLPIVPASTVSSVANALKPGITLKDILRKSTRLVTKTSFKLADVKEGNRYDTMDGVSPSSAALGEFDFELADRERMGELAPLTRVRSRDNGYRSTSDAL